MLKIKGITLPDTKYPVSGSIANIISRILKMNPKILIGANNFI